jgi:hypothetical protein
LFTARVEILKGHNLERNIKLASASTEATIEKTCSFP